MSYAQHASVVNSGSLRQRETACASQQRVSDPQKWVNAVAWFIPTVEWTDAWAIAETENPGADHGSNESVISDDMVLQGVMKEFSRNNPKPWVQPSGAHDAYGKYMHVLHNDAVWQSTVDGNVWEPGVSGWTQVS